MYKLNDDYPVGIKLRIMAGQVYAAAELGMWCFSPERELYYTTSPNEKELLSLLNLSGALDYFFSRDGGWDKPVILSDSLGMTWIGECYQLEEETSPYVMVGPFFMNNTSVRQIEMELRERINSVKVRRELMRILEQVPVLHISVGNQYASMLHFTITDEMVKSTDFYYQANDERQVHLKSEFEDNEIEAIEADRSVDMEKRLLQAVKDGNEKILELMNDAANSSQGYIGDSGNSVRDGKNSLIILNALSSRAASEGGLPLKVCRDIERKYMQEVEQCKSNTELHRLNIQMMTEYVAKVKETNSNTQVSKSIKECCEYIRNHVQEELSVDNIAKDMGYTTYYFSKKFNKEMGIRITDYIKHAKIDYAKIALISSQKSIQEISDALHFGTRNYFSKVFHEVVGMTPVAYRERMG